MTDIDLIKQALEYLEDNQHHIADHERHTYVMMYNDCITALKTRLAQPEQEPVCPACKAEVLYECVACSSNNYPPQPEQCNYPDCKCPTENPCLKGLAQTQEPVVWADYESKGIHHKPVAWMDADGNVSDNNDHKCFPIPLYTHLPQRKPLTDDELSDIWFKQSTDWMEFARAIEAAHDIKENT